MPQCTYEIYNEPLPCLSYYSVNAAVLGCEERQRRGCMPYKSWNKAYENCGARSRKVATPGISFCVFVDYSNKLLYKMLIFSWSYTISSIYALVVGNMPYGKRHTSRTKPVLLQVWCIRLKITFTPIVFEQGARSVRCILAPEKLLRKRRKNMTPPSIGQLEKRTSSRATDDV